MPGISQEKNIQSPYCHKAKSLVEGSRDKIQLKICNLKINGTKFLKYG
jgi:hypothetical protein